MAKARQCPKRLKMNALVASRQPGGACKGKVDKLAQAVRVVTSDVTTQWNESKHYGIDSTKANSRGPKAQGQTGWGAKILKVGSLGASWEHRRHKATSRSYKRVRGFL